MPTIKYMLFTESKLNLNKKNVRVFLKYKENLKDVMFSVLDLKFIIFESILIFRKAGILINLCALYP